ncbi:MAG: hypothetical protein ACI88H_000710 [Cocleimonas sp.]|jgi:hypothetical protein
MIKIKVNTQSTPHYVLSTDLRAAIEAEYPADAAIDIAKKYSELIYGSAARVLSRNPSTYGIYPHDIAAIFKTINVDVEFYNEHEVALNVNHEISGIFCRRRSH